MPKKKTPSKANEEPTTEQPASANPPKQTKVANPKQPKLANPPKKPSDEIDDIFASKKRKNPEAEKSQIKPEENVKKEKKKRKKISDEGGSRRRTNDGLKIYRVDELGINKAGSGFTNLCPFDCSCCF